VNSRSILSDAILALVVILISAPAAQAARRDGCHTKKHAPPRQMVLREMHHPLGVSIWVMPCLEGALAITPDQRARLNELNDRFTDRVYVMVSRHYGDANAEVPALQEALDRLNRRAEHRAWCILTPLQRQALRKYNWTYYSASSWDEGGVSPGVGDFRCFMGPRSERPFGMRPHRVERGDRVHRGKRHRQHQEAKPQ